MMRTKIVMIFSVLVLAFLNYGIYAKDRIARHGRTMLFELDPADSRSLMQGDYMRLRYTVALEAQDSPGREKVPVRGYLVIRPDEDNIARFVRFHNGENPAPGESLVRYRLRHEKVRIVPDSFFVQEGHAGYYEDSVYGIFKFDGPEKYLLTGLAGQDRKPVMPS